MSLIDAAGWDAMCPPEKENEQEKEETRQAFDAGEEVWVVERDEAGNACTKMGKYVETVSVEDFAGVIRRTEDALGINLQTVKNPVAAELREQLDTAQARILELEDQLDEYEGTVLGLERQLTAATSHINNGAVDAAQAEAAKARNQLELLREMYNELLAKVVGGGGE